MGHDVKPRPPLTGPVLVRARFYMPRPKNHFRTNGKLKWWAPTYHAIRPDLDKLERALNDALHPWVIKDDAQIVRHETVKVYTPIGQVPSVSIEVRELA